jgi:hypothetical protein
MEFPEANRRLIAALTDPLLGASADSIAKFKANMEKPGVALALYTQLREKVCEFNPEDMAKMPANVVEMLHKHFPTETTVLHHRGTQVCTVGSNTFGFSHNGRTLHDDRVLSLHDVGTQGLKIFADNCVELVHPSLHPKMHAVFLKAEDGCTKIDLCDFFDWCKCSVLEKEHSTVCCKETTFCFMETPFGRVFVGVHVLKNAEECTVDLLNGDNTVQIQVKGVKPTIIGIGLFTPNYCKRCKKLRSDTVKLKECSRCILLGVKLFYCSRTCQLLDYPNHRQVCTYDWCASDWRENAPVSA